MVDACACLDGLVLEFFVDGWDVDAFKDRSRIWNDDGRALALLVCLGAELNGMEIEVSESLSMQAY